MPLTATKTQGIKVFIGTKAADGATDTYTQIKRCKVLGEIGPEAQTIDATALEDAAKEKLKGIPDMGDLEVGGNRVYTDTGQNALKTAGEDVDDDPYNFRIEVPGAAAGGQSVRQTFKALVVKYRDKPGQVDGLIEFGATLAITGTVTQTAF